MNFMYIQNHHFGLLVATIEFVALVIHIAHVRYYDIMYRDNFFTIVIQFLLVTAITATGIMMCQ